MMCALCTPNSLFWRLHIKLQIPSLELSQLAKVFQKQQMLLSYTMTFQVVIANLFIVKVQVGIDPFEILFIYKNNLYYIFKPI